MADSLSYIKETPKSSEKPGGPANYMAPKRRRRRRKARRYADTEAGAIDDDATDRIKKRRKMLEQA